MSKPAIVVEDLWKNFRLYHEKNQYIKAAALRGRRAKYEEFWALQGVSFEIPFGSTFGIIGSNGSGKSTLLKCLAKILVPNKGSVTVNGRLSALLELGAGFHPELTGRENVFLNGAILGMTRKDIAAKYDEIISFSGLEKFIDTPVKNYSSGMVVRLGFAIAANVEPEILLIDEVLAVGDQSFQQRCLEKIEAFRQDGRTIVFVSHGLSQVTQLCAEAAWIDRGNLKMVGDAMKVVAEYTGVSHDALPKVEGELGERWGSGEVQITQVEFLDSTGKPLPLVTTGKPVTIRVHFDAFSPIKNPVVGIRVTHLHGPIVWGANTKRRAAFISEMHGPGYIDIVIPDAPFLEGTYDLTVAISDKTEVHAFDHWEKRIRFDVHQHDVFDEGYVTVESTWDVNHATRS
jgi:ABC-type polysaccharide/polyol phosphate transport system ATPase subunit